MGNKFKFTKAALNKLSCPPDKVQILFYDTAQSGLAIRVKPTGVKSFLIYKRIKGRTSPVKVTLGKYPEMTIEQAQNQTKKELAVMVEGINPNELKQVHENERVTLEQVYSDYIAGRKLRPSSIRNYKQNLDCYLEEWKQKPLRSLTEDTIKQIHKTISKNSEAQANQTMRFIRALFNYAKYEYRGLDDTFIFAENPVKILSHQRSWNKVPRKQTRLHQDELSAWFNVIEETRLEAEAEREVFTVSVCDAVIMALLTGLRKSELLELTWDRVNLQRKSFYIDKTKNGDPLQLPITDYLLEILKRRWASRSESLYVFDAPNDQGRIIEPKKVVAKIGVSAGVSFGWHDLRRTFTSTAEILNVGGYTLKRLVNHRTSRNDVTAGYIILTAEELREPAQLIVDAILEQAGIKEPVKAIDAQISDLLGGLDEKAKRELLFQLAEQQVKQKQN